ncbi:restriction endonuclease subunit S [Nocardia gamkensis]|uniref:Type I restriction modification DNA specificity domain-containing protein n=1 Tax=Nocardia gamkensis TaxID=352869 RepID=A0A7X6LB87_9NOCA|nr:restriction endonuclease subunit S [Nocardia gamkensis]NKY31306.1 hypothetical protein [Nocardia gamkensis]NQE72589.1 uncharacterized protein [Nocardia gamkensis]
MNLKLDKSGWKRVRLGDVVQRSRKQADPAEAGIERYVAGGHIDSESMVIQRWGDVGDGQMGSTFRYVFEPGQILFVSARPYLRKTGVVDFSGVVADKTYVLDADPDNGLLQNFLPWVLSSDPFVEYATAEATGSMNPRLLWGQFQQYEFKLPSLDEQNKIADLIWRVESHRVQLRASRNVMRATRLYFVDQAIGRALKNRAVPLARVAEIRGGIQKGKRTSGEVVDRPYVRVANVQAGEIDLADVKTISVSVADAERYALRDGDVLMTEGGDIDKLGRGAVWRCQIPQCLHQNHVFAVRVSEPSVSPYWISLHTESTHGRAYFRVAAKRTSNLASINKTQVSEFPIGILEGEDQLNALSTIDRLDSAMTDLDTESVTLTALRTVVLTEIFGDS